MSTDGRAHDALLSILDGYGLEDKDRYEIAEDVIKVIGPLYMEFGERVAKKTLLAEMSEAGISFGPKSDAKVRWSDNE